MSTSPDITKLLKVSQMGSTGGGTIWAKWPKNALGETLVFHAWLYGRFIDLQNNLRRKKLHRMNQSSNSLGGSFSNGDNVKAPIQFRKESQP